MQSDRSLNDYGRVLNDYELLPWVITAEKRQTVSTIKCSGEGTRGSFDAETNIILSNFQIETTSITRDQLYSIYNH